MQPDCQLWAFNVEVTDSFTIAFSPCFHNCPPTLVPSLGTTGRAALDGALPFPFHDTSSPRTWRSSAIPPNSFGPSLVILGRFPPRPGPLDLIFEMGRGTQILWPHKNKIKKLHGSTMCYPQIQRKLTIYKNKGSNNNFIVLKKIKNLILCVANQLSMNHLRGVITSIKLLSRVKSYGELGIAKGVPCIRNATSTSFQVFNSF